MRQFAGFGTAKQTNERYKFLLAQGQTGLSVAFDMPALMGYDSDHPRALGEVGKCGVAISTLRDMQDLFEGIDLGSITTSMTINCTAPMALAMYIAAAQQQGVTPEKLERHAAGGHAQGIHRAKRVDLPARAVHAHHHRHDGVLREARAQVEHDLDLGLSHPRGRFDGGAGARVHLGRWIRIRRGGHRSRLGRRRFCAAAVVFLQCAF